MNRPTVRRDALPEFAHYVDTGCSVSPTCLACPLERCRYEEPRGGAYLNARARREEIIALHERGLNAREVAKRVGCSRRTVFRQMASAK